MIDKPLVMGIINITPDSFYQGHLNKGIDEIVQLARQMITDGADILDIGGQSTRPGSVRINADEELKRVIPVIEAIMKEYNDCIISIDTYHSKVAKEAVTAGASIVNDISSGTMDKEMLMTVSALHVPYISMHMKGTPQTMQQQASYENVTGEVLDFFIRKKNEYRMAGIADVIIDPGFGFGKDAEENLSLFSSLRQITQLGFPTLVGTSRKSMIGKITGRQLHTLDYVQHSRAPGHKRGEGHVRDHCGSDLVSFV